MSSVLKKIAPAWRELERSAHVGPIRNAAHYDEMVGLMHELIEEVGSDKAHPLNGLLYVVSDLIRDYDQRRHALPDAGAVDVLKFLMDSHGLKQSDLSEIGTQSVVSEILSGKRALNVRQIARLAQRFGVSTDVFIDETAAA
jgi:HTH-type transcriptional regulator/antitoxin HigA